MKKNPFSGKDGQLYVQKINDFLDNTFAGLGNVMSALTNHREKLLADAEADVDVKEFNLKRISDAINLTSGADLKLRELKNVILPFKQY